jgi:hypothetical protein
MRRQMVPLGTSNQSVRDADPGWRRPVARLRPAVRAVISRRDESNWLNRLADDSAVAATERTVKGNARR